ncbi:MAG: CPBP family intramembrane glutamic endopeptidase [Candidatus Scalindua sp.]
MLEKTGFMADTVDYENGVYDFGKVMRRILMLAALIMFIVLRKSLRFGTLIYSGLKIRPGFLRQFLLGLSMAALSLLIYYGIGLVSGVWIIHIDFMPGGRVEHDLVVAAILDIIKYSFVSCLIGFSEEIIFRGFLLQSIRENTSLPMAVCVCSFIYSILHFFRAKALVATGFQPFVGFLTMVQFFKPIFFQFFEHLPSTIGLFLLGVVLSYAFIRTKSLYLSIGLHTGMVFMMKADALFLVCIGEKLEWLLGDSKLVTGILVWFLLICMLFVIKKIYSRTVTVHQGENICL